MSEKTSRRSFLKLAGLNAGAAVMPHALLTETNQSVPGTAATPMSDAPPYRVGE